MLENQGGMYYLNDSTAILPTGVQLKVSISIAFTDETFTLTGDEPEFVVTMKDPAIKNKLINNGEPVTLRTYENCIDVELYCTQYG